MLVAATSANSALLLAELGLVVVGLALLARAAAWAGFSPIPLYLLGGLALGRGGIVPLGLSEDFIGVGAEIGVVLLLFMLGLEYTAAELAGSLRTGLRAGGEDLLLNFTPGVLFALAWGWSPVTAVLLGGVTYISSSGVVAKVLGDLGRMGNRETPAVLTILVVEDLAMALYLPVVAVLLAGTGWTTGALSLGLAVATVVVALIVALRFGGAVSRVLFSTSDEVLLLTTLGTVLLVGGLAQRLQVSAAVGAFLVGLALSGPVAERARELLGPLRDLFAATFFVFFGLQIDPGDLPPVLAAAALLALVTGATKILTGWRAARALGVRAPGRLRAGTVLAARGEFSIVIAGLGVASGVEEALGPLAAAYVLILAVGAPILARIADPLAAAVAGRGSGRDAPVS
ncbi:MAG TPA: cation:proton antiporter [Egibacteraceae bacterium]|nr:cation:proton antiporter [Egibacteraceae bacterium]